MFYEDLSPYTYLTDASGRPDEDVFQDVTDGMRFVRLRPAYRRLNVGRLDGSRPWPAGPVPGAFGRRLRAVVEAQGVNQMMGLHECDLCPEPLPGSEPWYVPGPGHLHPGQGTGEIRVPGPPGVVFATPRLVGHYVTGHGYRPPRPFVDAVLAFDPYGSWEARFPGVRFPWIPEDAVLRHIDDEGW